MSQSNWYYYEAGQQAGPISEARLRDLLTDGTLAPNTPVWSSGMDNWQPASRVFGADTASNTAVPPAPPQQSSEPAQHNIRKTPVILVILFGLITFGIYLPCWFLTRREALNTLNTCCKLTKDVLIVSIVLFSLSLFSSLAAVGIEWIGIALDSMDIFLAGRLVSIFGNVAALAAQIIILVKAFDVRRMLREHFNDHMGQNVYFSGVFTFFFTIYYLQYKINRL